ncbi:MAG: hypothetical protein BGO78_12290 [Chloroflexi bacterium 44-23]|nr:MAG: hypothetical protein BGO78_12290 [Chloroflexi bacterium 44-23]
MDYFENKILKVQEEQPLNLIKRVDCFFRRALDLLVAVLGLIFLSPLFLWVSIRIKRDSPGPVFFQGLRAGLHGKPFYIIKFRTMYDEESSNNGLQVTAQDDDRITPLGKFLRDSKLNELPQLWNVLRGDMSLVGPRPEALSIASLWPEDIRNVILSVRPGITSPASVLYRTEEKLLNQENVMEEYVRSILPSKLRLDLLYVRNRSFLSDIDVIFWTAIALLPALRNKEIAEPKLFWGPLSLFVTRFMSWFVIDTAVVFVSALVAELIWRTSIPINLGYANAFLASLLIGLFFSLINALFGLNLVTWSRAAAGDALVLGFSAAISTGLLVLLKIWLLEKDVLPVGLLITTGLLSFFGFVVARYRERLITGAATRWFSLRSGSKSLAERVLIVGAGDNGELAIWLFNRHRLAATFNVVGIIDDDPRKLGMRVNGVPILGSTADLQDIVTKFDIGVIVYTIYNISPADRYRLIRQCERTSARLVIIPDVMTQLYDNHPIPINLIKVRENPLSIEEKKQYINKIELLARSGDLDGILRLTPYLREALDQEKRPENKYNQ